MGRACLLVVAPSGGTKCEEKPSQNARRQPHLVRRADRHEEQFHAGCIESRPQVSLEDLGQLPAEQSALWGCGS